MGKSKRNKPNYWYKQSAIIPYRNNGELEILLVTSRKKKKWIIPKGIIEQNLLPLKSAEKEALEEAGIKGITQNKSIGKYKYKKWGGTCNVKIFAMEVTEILDCWDEDFRERKWMNLENVKMEIEDSELLKIVISFFDKFVK